MNSSTTKNKNASFRTEEKIPLPLNKKVLYRQKNKIPIVHSFGGLIMSDLTMAIGLVLVITGLIANNSVIFPQIAEEMLSLGEIANYETASMIRNNDISFNLSSYGTALSAGFEPITPLLRDGTAHLNEVFCQFFCK